MAKRTDAEEKPEEPELPALPEGLMLRVQRWPVLRRDKDDDGRLLRTTDAFHRTRAALDTREAEVVEWKKKQQVVVLMGTGDRVTFSLNTGRAVRMQDWIVEAESLKEFKRLRKTRFPRKKKPVLAEA